MRKAFFFDRDGVINIDKGYLYQISEFEFQKDIFSVMNHIQKAGYDLFVVTNQSGIARGYFTLEQYRQLNRWMLEQLNFQGIYIKEVYFCPYYPVQNQDASEQIWYRKPNPGMILKAAEEYDIDLSHSVLIGDKESDIIAGMRAGIRKNILFDQSDRLKDSEDYIRIKDLKELTCMI